MKRFSFLLAMLALALALGLAFVSCDNGTTDNGTTREPETFSGTIGSTAYTLTISQPKKRAVLEGDDYELTIVQSGATKTSTGTVKTVDQGTFTLQPDIADSPSFTVTTSGASITTITGSITLEDSTSATAPGAVSISGTYVVNGVPWNSYVVTITITFSGSTFTETTTRIAGHQTTVESGFFTVSNNIITCSVTYATDGKAGYSFNLTIIDSNTISNRSGDIFRK